MILKLNNNEIKHFDSLCNSLKSNNTLIYLQLEYNKISNIQLLCNSLQYNTSINKLKIGYNDKIQDEQNLDYLLDMLKINKQIYYLTYSYNKKHYDKIKNKINDLLNNGYNTSLIYFDNKFCS